MKRILDPRFRYVPSFETDVRKTFERLRREQQAALASIVTARYRWTAPSSEAMRSTLAAGSPATSTSMAPRGGSRMAN